MKLRFHTLFLLLATAAGLAETNPRLLEAIQDLQASIPAVREQAAITLGRLNDRAAVPALTSALKDSERGVRREAAKALGFLKDSRGVDALIATLKDSDPNVRFYSAYALGEIRSSKATQALLKTLDDPVWSVRDQATWALREISDPKATQPLIGELKEKNADEAHLIWALSHSKDSRVPQLLTRLLEGPEEFIRVRAMKVLARLKDPKTIGALLQTLEDRSPAVRVLALEALLDFGGELAQEPIRKMARKETDPAAKKKAREAVRQMSHLADLAAYWNFDGKPGEEGKDLTGRKNDGKNRGCAQVKGKMGKALQFSKGRYVEMGRPPAISMGNRPLTIMAWIKSAAPTGVVIARGGAACGFSLYLKDGIAKIGIRRSADIPPLIASGGQVPLNEWVHLTGVIKRERLELYLNGEPFGASEKGGLLPGDCGQGLEIGYDAGNSPAEIMDNFVGLIDEVKIFTAALSVKDIKKQAETADAFLYDQD